MFFVASRIELSTAATDAALTIESLLVAAWILRTPCGARWRATLWGATLGVLALASLLGAAAHGLVLSAGTQAALWRPLYALLGLVVALMLVAAIADLRGPTLIRGLLPAAVALAMGFFVLSEAKGGDFGVFVLFHAGAGLVALAVYGILAWHRRLAGAGTIAASLALSLAAGAVQASNATLLPLLPLDHNGLYHLVTMVAVALLGRGVVAGQRTGAEPGD